MRLPATLCISKGVRWTGLQRRFEATVAGRVVISVFVVVTLLAVLTANLPVSRLQDLLLGVGHRYIYATGLDQSWSVFSPDPRRQVIHAAATVTFADGSTKTWQVRQWNDVLGAYVDYHWLKWQEFVVSPGYEQSLGRPFALYAARQLATPTKRPVRVVVTNTYYDLSQPGIPQAQFNQHATIYQTNITPADLKAAS